MPCPCRPPSRAQWWQLRAEPFHLEASISRERHGSKPPGAGKASASMREYANSRQLYQPLADQAVLRNSLFIGLKNSITEALGVGGSSRSLRAYPHPRRGYFCRIHRRLWPPNARATRRLRRGPSRARPFHRRHADFPAAVPPRCLLAAPCGLH